MRCDEIMKYLEELAPGEYACSWDNTGLLAGRSKKEVKKILVALDVTDAVAELAVREGADMLLTHHPLIFSPLKRVNDLDFIGARIVKLLQHDISYYAMHTNFDSAPGCMADLASKLMELKNPRVLEHMGETVDGCAYGIGRTGVLPVPMSVKELAEKVKAAFGLAFVTVYGMETAGKPVTNIAVSPGSGKSMIPFALEAGAEVLITGDIGHHEGIDAVAGGLVVMDAGHYGLEHIFVDFMVSYIEKRMGGEIQVIKAPVDFPAAVL